MVDRQKYLSICSENDICYLIFYQNDFFFTNDMKNFSDFDKDIELKGSVRRMSIIGLITKLYLQMLIFLHEYGGCS